MAPSSQSDVLRGTIDLLVLKTLALQPTHGWGIGQRIQQVTGGELEVNQGSLYPALQRLEHSGLIESEWGSTENNRRARYYSLTASGRRQFAAKTVMWTRYSEAVFAALRIT